MDKKLEVNILLYDNDKSLEIYFEVQDYLTENEIFSIGAFCVVCFILDLPDIKKAKYKKLTKHLKEKNLTFKEL